MAYENFAQQHAVSRFLRRWRAACSACQPLAQKGGGRLCRTQGQSDPCWPCRWPPSPQPEACFSPQATARLSKTAARARWATPSPFKLWKTSRPARSRPPPSTATPPLTPTSPPCRSTTWPDWAKLGIGASHQQQLLRQGWNRKRQYLCRLHHGHRHRSHAQRPPGRGRREADRREPECGRTALLGHRGPPAGATGQHRKLHPGGQRARRIARAGRTGRSANSWLAFPVLFELSAVLKLSRIVPRGNRSTRIYPLPSSAHDHLDHTGTHHRHPEGAGNPVPGAVPVQHRQHDPRDAHQGSRRRGRCAHQPVDRLWPDCGPGRHGRPNHPDALHHPGLEQLPATAGHHAHHHLPGAASDEKRGRRAGDRPVARICASRAVAGCQCILAWQRQVAQRWHADRHAAQGCRRRDLCAGPGQPDCCRRRCRSRAAARCRSTT